MQINSVSNSNQAFGANLAIVGGKTIYSKAQKKLVAAIDKFLCSNEGVRTRESFNEITDRCYILAKPSGETGISLQAYIKVFDPKTEWTNWYDKINGRGEKILSGVVRKTKDCISTFEGLVEDLRIAQKDDMLTYANRWTDEFTSPMKISPKVITIA